MKKQKYLNKIKGIGLIEIVIGVSVLAVSFLAISGFYQKALNVSRGTDKLTQASFLLEEGIEVARFLRDENWQNISTLSTGADYYLTFDGSAWSTTTTSTLIDSVFDRILVVEDVYRDFNDDIVFSGGVLDTDTRQVEISVSWYDGTSTTTQIVSTYLTNFLEI